MILASSELQGASCFGGGVLFWCRSRPCFPARVNFSPGSHHPSHTQPWKVWNCSFILGFSQWHDIVYIQIKKRMKYKVARLCSLTSPLSAFYFEILATTSFKLPQKFCPKWVEKEGQVSQWVAKGRSPPSFIAFITLATSSPAAL